MLLREVLQLPHSTFAPALLAAIDAVDKVHRLPKVVGIPVRITQNRTELGAYIYRTRPNRPEAIEVSARSNHPQLTLIHEVGHFLDHVVLNPLKDGFACDFDSKFDRLILRWDGDTLVRQLGNILRRHGKNATVSARKHMQHHLTPQELWARTYTQWIAVLSGDSEIERQVQMIRLKGSYFAGQWCTFLWEDSEFNGIIPLVDAIMKEAGLQ